MKRSVNTALKAFVVLGKIIFILIFFSACSPKPLEKAPALSTNIIWLNRPKNFSLNFNNKFTILEFFSEECQACSEMKPILQDIAKIYADKINLIGIYSDDSYKTSSQNSAKQWVDSHHFSYPIIYDANNNFFNAYHLDGWPTLVFINKNGEINNRLDGRQMPQYLYKSIEKFIKGA